MYNGIGLQTARGSGTNGYIQSNKFFVRHKLSKVVTDPSSFKSFESGQGTGGISRKPNRDILEHDRKRQIELKLLVLEEKLTDQGYTDSEVAEKLQEARINLEAAQADDEDGGAGAVFGSDKRVSDTQTHQIAARKEKQMETLRAALGIGAETENQRQQLDVPVSDFEDIGDDVEPIKSHKKDVLGEKKHGKDALKMRGESKKGSKYKKDEADELDEPKRHKKKEERRGRDKESSESGSEGKAVRESKKKHRRSAHISESDESDVDVRKRRHKSSVKQSRSRRRDSDYSDSESDSKSDSDSSSDSGRDKKFGKSRKRHDSDDDYSSDEDSKIKSQKGTKSLKRGRHGSEDESSSDIERNDTRNHSEKKRNDQRTASRSAKDDNICDDHRVGKERRDKDGGRYGLKSDSESDKALKVKNKHEKSRRRHDSDEDGPSSYKEKDDRNLHSEKKRNDLRSASRKEKDDIIRDDHRIGEGRRDKYGGRNDLKIDSESDKILRAKNNIEKTRRRHDSDEDEPSYREKEDRRNHSEKKRNDLEIAFRSEKDDIVREDHRVSKGRAHNVGARDDLKIDSDSDIALKGKNNIEKTRRRHDSDEDEPFSDREKEHRRNPPSEKKRNDQRTSFRSEKDDIVRGDHRGSKGRRDEVRGRYGVNSDSDSDKAPKRKNTVENTRRRRDSEEDESVYDKKKNHRSKKHDSDEDDNSDSRDSSSESDASEKIDHRHKRSHLEIKSLEKDSSRRLYDLNDRERKAREGYGGRNEENIKHKRAAQKVDDGGLDTLKDLEKLYQTRNEKMDGSPYGGQEPKQIKRKTNDEDLDEQPERKTRRRDLGKEAELGGSKNEPEGKISLRNKEAERADDPSNRRGTIQSRVEVRNESRRPDQDHDVNNRGRGESDNDNDKERQGRKHGRDAAEDVSRYGRDRREQEEGHVSRYGRDRDVDSSKRAKYDDSRSSGRRYDDDRRESSRSSGRRYDDERRDDSRSRR